MTSIRIAILTDIHAAPAGSPAGGWHAPFEPAKGASLARAAVEELGAHQFDVAFVLGDVANNGDGPSLDDAIAEIAKLGEPTWIVSGNHDLRVSEHGLQHAIERGSGSLKLPSLPGESVKDDFIVAGLRFSGTDDSVVALTESPKIDEWDGRPVLLLSHYPIISREQASLAAGWGYAGDPKGLNGVADSLAARTAPTISFHGHLHLGDAVAQGSYLQLGFSALIENGHQIAIVEIDSANDSVSVTVSPFATSGDARTAATIGNPTRTWTYVNGQWRS